jgi:hypothetical protein
MLIVVSHRIIIKIYWVKVSCDCMQARNPMTFMTVGSRCVLILLSAPTELLFSSIMSFTLNFLSIYRLRYDWNLYLMILLQLITAVAINAVTLEKFNYSLQLLVWLWLVWLSHAMNYNSHEYYSPVIETVSNYAENKLITNCVCVSECGVVPLKERGE